MITTERIILTREIKHLLTSWVEARCLEVASLNALPKLGLLVRHCNVPVAVAFLREMEGGKALIDGFLADPDSDLAVRDECLNALIRDLITLAQKNRFTGILGLTTNPKVVERAKRLGFSLMDHRLVSMEVASCPF